MAWVCPRCGRRVGRTGQWHSCQPPRVLEDWLADLPAEVARIVAAIRPHLSDLGDDVLLEPTKSSLMIKRARTFAEVKPRRARAEVSFILSRHLDHPRVSRTLDLSVTRRVHVVEVADVGGVDAELLSWLSEAYRSSST